VNLHHVLVAETCDDAGFVEEHVDELLLSGEVRENALDDDRALEAAGTVEAAEEDFGHSAGAEQPENLVPSDLAREILQRALLCHSHMAGVSVKPMRAAPTVLAIVVLGSSTAASIAYAAKPSKADRKRAVQLFKSSQEAYQKGQFREAADLLERAYGLDPNPTLLFNKARALESAGDAEGTIDAYRRYLEADPKAPDRVGIVQRIENLEKQIEAKKELERRAEEERKRREALELAPPPPPPPPPPIAPPPPRIEPVEKKSVSPWPWVILGVGAAGVGAGGALGAMAASKHSAAVDEPVQMTAESLSGQANDLALGANISYGVGGAIVAAGLVWGIIDLATAL
jgi:tetratricopeptide (TPR) repeat protein